MVCYHDLWWNSNFVMLLKMCSFCSGGPWHVKEHVLLTRCSVCGVYAGGCVKELGLVYNILQGYGHVNLYAAWNLAGQCV